jgi:hypothetical protein
MSKHDKDITWRVSCDSTEQRDRLKAKARELSAITELENAELLEYLLDRALPPKTHKTNFGGTPPCRIVGSGADDMRETDIS